MFQTRLKSIKPRTVEKDTAVSTILEVSGPAWDVKAFVLLLKLAMKRIEIQNTKRQNAIVKTRRVVAEYLSAQNEVLARIQGEKLLRDTAMIQASDIVLSHIRVLVANCKILELERKFPSLTIDLQESIAAIAFAGARLNVPELNTVLEKLRNHFGADCVDAIARCEGPHALCIDRRLVRKLDVRSSDEQVVEEELCNVAAQFNVQWTSTRMGPGIPFIGYPSAF